MAEASRIVRGPVAGGPGGAGGIGGGLSVPASAPPKRADKLTAWLVLGGLLMLAAVPLMVDLGRPALVFGPETQAVGRSIETWSRQRAIDDGGWGLALVIPMREGEPREVSRPGLTWLDMLGLWDISPVTSETGPIIYRLRLVSVAFGLLLIAAVYWAGHAIGGIMTAGLSALVMLGSPAWIPLARLGVSLVPGLALTTLGVAAALSAIGPRRSRPAIWREGLGWTISGLALGLATLTVGWLALGLGLVPIITIALMRPDRWASALMGTLGAAAIAGLCLLGWTGFVLNHTGQLPSDLGSGGGDVASLDWRPVAWIGMSGWRLGLMVVAVMPWSLWLISGLIQPFSSSTQGWRERMFTGWGWFVAVVGVLLLGLAIGVGQQTGQQSQWLLYALPPAAIVVGQLFRRLIDLSGQGRHARVWQVGRWPMAIFFVGLSVLVPLSLWLPQAMIEGDLTGRPWIEPLGWGYSLAVGVLLMIGAVLGVRFCFTHHPGRALLCWALWTVVVSTVLAVSISRGPLMRPLPHGAEPRDEILPLSGSTRIGQDMVLPSARCPKAKGKSMNHPTLGGWPKNQRLASAAIDSRKTMQDFHGLCPLSRGPCTALWSPNRRKKAVHAPPLNEAPVVAYVLRQSRNGG